PGAPGCDRVVRTEQRLHARVRRPREQGAAGMPRQPQRGGEHGVTRPFGEGRTRRSPPQAVDDVVLEPRGRHGAGRSLSREREHVLVGGAHADLAPPAATTPGGGDVGGRQPPRGRGRAHSEYPNRGSHARILGRACSRGPKTAVPYRNSTKAVSTCQTACSCTGASGSHSGASVRPRALRSTPTASTPAATIQTLPSAGARPAAEREAPITVTTAPATSTASRALPVSGQRARTTAHAPASPPKTASPAETVARRAKATS